MTTKKELYIHIGTHKTGSTALQLFFSKNRKFLQTNEIYYPESVHSHIAHHNLGWVFDIETWGVEKNILDQLKSPTEEWISLLESSSGYSKILISSETLSSADAGIIHQIKELTIGYQVKIIIYLRRQDDMSNSVFNEVIKDGFWREVDTKKIPYHLNYLEMIGRWATAFEKKNIIIRPYESRQFHKESIFLDFLCHTFCISSLNGFVLPEGNPRPKLSRDTLEYKRMVNNLLLTQSELRSLSPILIKYSMAENHNRSCKEYNLLSSQERLELIDRFLDSNEKIAREYLGREDGRLFYDPLPDPNQQWESYPGLTADKIVDISRFFKKKSIGCYRLLGKAVAEALLSHDRTVQKAAQILEPGFEDIITTI